MKILILSGLHPTNINKSGGIFITRRCERLPENIEYYLVSEVQIYSPLLEKIKKNKKLNEGNKKLNTIQINNVTWHFIKSKKNLLNAVLDKIIKGNEAKRLLKDLQKQVNFKEYDLLHINWAYPEGYIGKLIKEKYGIPYVLTLHGSDIHTNPFNNEKIKKYTLEALEQAEKLIFVSNALLKSAFSLGYAKDNYKIIPNGIDCDKFKLMDKNCIKSELNLTGKVVGFAGNLVYVKRADKLPSIFENISRLYNQALFIVVGDGELREQIEEECNRKNLKVKFFGRVEPDKVSYYMNAMDIMILPSRNEGWGCVIIEANACGVPVVGSNEGGIPEAIGDFGITVHEGENFEKRFAEETVKLLKGTSDSKALNSRARSYDWNKIVSLECNVYEEVINES